MIFSPTPGTASQRNPIAELYHAIMARDETKVLEILSEKRPRQLEWGDLIQEHERGRQVDPHLLINTVVSSTNIMREILEKMNVGFVEEEDIQLAALKGEHFEALELLIKKSNVISGNVLIEATKKGNLDILNLILPRVYKSSMARWGLDALGEANKARHQSIADRLMTIPAIKILADFSQVPTEDQPEFLSCHSSEINEDIQEGLLAYSINNDKLETFKHLLTFIEDFASHSYIPYNSFSKRFKLLGSSIDSGAIEIVKHLADLLDSMEISFKDRALRQAALVNQKAIYQWLCTTWQKDYINEFESELLARDLSKDLHDFSSHIFLPREELAYPKTGKYENYKNPLYSSQWYKFMVHNNDKYIHYVPNEGIKGRALTLQVKHESIPIGYTIYVPKGQIRSVIINVYGGHTTNTPGNKGHHPGVDLNPLDGVLLGNSVVVIHTNLYDLIKLDVYQSKMSLSLFNKILASIHCLHEILLNNPEELHPSLEILKSVPPDLYSLYGASFGGMIVSRYLQEYGGIRAISHNGALSAKMREKSDLTWLLGERPLYSDWLDPIRYIHKIKDPILVLQNLDDHIVNAKRAFHFSKSLIKSGLSNYHRLHITPRGNPKDDGNYKGHFLTTYPDDFERYCDAILQFMEKPRSSLPKLNEWRSFSGNIKANTYYREATPEKRFLAYVFRSKETCSDFGLWEEKYKSKYLGYLFANMLIKNPRIRHAELKRLVDNLLLTDYVITNAFRGQAGAMLDYFNEGTQRIPFPDGQGYSVITIDARKILNDSFINMPKVIEALRNAITSIDDDTPLHFARFLLENLYVNNPHLVSEFSAKVDAARTPAYRRYKARTIDMKQKMDSSLQADRRLILTLWQQTAREALKLERQKAPALPSTPVASSSSGASCSYSQACSSSAASSSGAMPASFRAPLERRCKRDRHAREESERIKRSRN